MASSPIFMKKLEYGTYLWFGKIGMTRNSKHCKKTRLKILMIMTSERIANSLNILNNQ